MRFSARSKVGILLSFIIIVTLISGFMVMVISRGTASQAAHSTIHAKYHGTLHKGSQVASGRLHGSVKKHSATAQKPRVVGTHTLNKKATGSHAKVVANKNAPGATDALPSPLLHSHVAEGQQLQNFNGISDLSQSVVNAAFFGFDPTPPNGFEVTPPDQGLCVGTDTFSGTKQVFEIVNESIRETNPDGSVDPTSLLGIFGGEVPLQFFFAPTAFAFGDPRCFYDSSTGTFIFTELGILQGGPDAGFTSVDVATFNGDFPFFNVIQVDTSELGTCFGDQPHAGLDNPNLVLTTDQFCDTGYLGASVFILD